MPSIVRGELDTIQPGALIHHTQTKVKANGYYVTVKDDPIDDHGGHVGAKMLDCSSTVKANGKFVCRDQDKATCGHKAVSTSSVHAG